MAVTNSIRQCRRCGVEFRRTAKGQPTKYCSVACRDVAPRCRPQAAQCVTCGTSYFPRYTAAGYCSMACRRYPERRVWPTTEEKQRAKDYRRRCRKRGAGYERFTRREIFERDGWRCGICGVLTDRSPSAHRNHRPSLDHIVPLARGGAHSRANTQCSHWICNSTKGARVAA